MSTASIYQKIISTPQKITFKDIFGGGRSKHTEGDADYAMIAGTSLDTVKTELGMLQKWQQPWLYMRILKAGLIISAVAVGAVALMIALLGVSSLPALNLLVIMIPPCIVPISLMVFFWEMNAPRDISLVQMIGYFAAGGVLSLLFTGIINMVVPIYGAVFAPVTEEPAKLLASMFFLQQINKKRGRVYGFTGLAIGAAVGAGFAAFESAQYAYNCLLTIELENGLTASVIWMDWSILFGVLFNIVLRNVCAICGHVLYCVPYACVAALNMGKNGNLKDALQDKTIWFVFAVSFISHALWNTHNGSYGIISVKIVIFTIILWSMALYGIRRSFKQLVDHINIQSTSNTSTSKLRIQGTKGVHAGVAFSLSSNEIIIGTDSSCKLTYPVHYSQIDKKHCKLLIQNGVVYLADLGTQTGTYLNGTKLPPLKGYPLKSGDYFTVGGTDQEFTVV